MNPPGPPRDPLACLHAALAAVVVRAWRLELDVPGLAEPVPESMLRGVWGAALHGLSQPLYQQVFEGSPQQVPQYLLRAADPPGDGGPAVEFLLFGTPDEYADEADDLLWLAWEQALRRGLGPRRRPGLLRQIRPLAWDGSTLRPARRQPGFALHPLPWPLDAIDAPCRLEFPSPLRLIHHDRLVERPAPADLAAAALRRVCALATAAGAVAAADALWESRHRWLQWAEGVPAGPWTGGRMDLSRYSASQEQELDLRGVAGRLDLPQGPGPLADMLAAAAWLHLGKGTVMGMGRLRPSRPRPVGEAEGIPPRP